jgi:hypothetical protein
VVVDGLTTRTGKKNGAFRARERSAVRMMVMHDVVQNFAGKLLGGITEDVFGRGICVCDAFLVVQTEDRVGFTLYDDSAGFNAFKHAVTPSEQ